MFWKILILVFCFYKTCSVSYASIIYFDEDTSKLTYSLSGFGIVFKKKSFPVMGYIETDNARDEQNQVLTLLKSLKLSARFVSKNIIFRRVINFDKYPEFTFWAKLDKPLYLHDSGFIELMGNLSFHGVTNIAIVKLRKKTRGDLTSLAGNLNIKMTDFGIKPPRILFFTVDNLIKTTVEMYYKENN